MKKFISIAALVALSVVLFAGCKKPVEPETTADVLLDDQIYNQALNSYDITKCDDIMSSTKKVECKNVVEGRLISVQAVNALDKSMCRQIKLDRYKANCEAGVDDAIASDAASEYMKEQRELTSELAHGDSVAACDTIKDNNFRQDCIANAIINKAIEQNDPDECEEIEDEESIELCKELVAGA